MLAGCVGEGLCCVTVQFRHLTASLPAPASRPPLMLQQPAISQAQGVQGFLWHWLVSFGWSPLDIG